MRKDTIKIIRFKNILLCIIASVLFCGCTIQTSSHGDSEDFEITVTADITTYEILVDSIEIISETETMPIVSSQDTSETTTEIVTEVNTSKSKMKLPDSFYDEFDQLIQKYPQFMYHNFSLAYYDIESGFTFELNPDNHYYIASVIKAPYAMFIYRLALAGEIDVEQKITYTEKFLCEGSGVIKDMEFGTEFTIEELIGFMLEFSDNSAYAMLRSIYEDYDYIEFIKELGIEHDEDLRFRQNEQICDNTAIRYGMALYDFFEENNKYSAVLKDHMLNTRQPLIYSNQGEVARKYGWYNGLLHDLAVVYSERPYVISILSDFGENEDDWADNEDMFIFKELSLLVDKYSSQLEIAEPDFEDIIVTQMTTINTTPKIVDEVDETMTIPTDPAILLSYINTKLRDDYNSLDALCEDLNLDTAQLNKQLNDIGYSYDDELNKFL